MIVLVDCLEVFYEDDLRVRSPEADFGVHWRGPDGSVEPRYRVASIGLTGEVYAVAANSQGPVLLLGAWPQRSHPFAEGRERWYAGPGSLDAQLDGWAKAVWRETVGWIAERLAPALPRYEGSG